MLLLASQSVIACIVIVNVYSYVYEPIVNELQQYVSSNGTFAAELNTTFKEANQDNVTFTDMYNMLNGWLNRVPTVNENCSIYTMLDLSPFDDTQTGNQILRYNMTTNWFYNYLNEWKMYLDSNKSAFIVPKWMNCVNMTEYIIPPNGYTSFNEFFYRKINLKYRPIANISDNSVIVSPADGFVYFIERNVSSNSHFMVKGESFNITQMLNNSHYAQRFEGGDIIEIVLMFDNYHRYHSVVSGFVQDMQQLSGWYFVDYNGRTDHCEENSNRRGVVYTVLDQNKSNNQNSMIASVHVGMGEVSSVNFNISPKNIIKKGDEVGYFAYGGSAILVLFPPGYIDHFSVRMNENVKMGQAIAKAMY